MSDKLQAFLQLQQRVAEAKAKGEDAVTCEIAKLEIELRQAFEELSDVEKDSLRLQRRVSHIESSPDDKLFSGATEVVEVFVMQRQPNGELLQMKLPGDAMMRVSNAIHEALRAVGEGFAQQDICRRLLESDPRLDLKNLVFEFNLSQGLLKNHR